MLIQISEGLKIFRRSFFAKRLGVSRYIGTPRQICSEIVEGCWNNREGFYCTSTGHFRQFYTRDFGICAEALIKLGHKDRVIKTLDYVLSKFSKHGKITTSITLRGRPFDFPTYASDSLPFILHSIRIAEADDILKKYKNFIEKETEKYCRVVFDKKTGMVRKERHLSSMKDYSKRNSSTYDNCMVGMLKEDLDYVGLKNPFASYDIKGTITRNLWNGKFFYDDLNKINAVYGDANVFPFWTGLFNERKIFESCLKSIKEAGLDRPFPLKYSNKRIKGQRMIWQEVFVGNYERDAVWMHLGLCYLDVLKKFGKENELKKCLKLYEQNISKYRNFLEVFNNRGRPFKSAFYYADEGMLWAAKCLCLLSS
ncbi:MAG: hypothetical protein N3D84_00360 [Candidatus Woesearchaeota archaeon]|nr:hypothetical protein [Candidatus Woesearchaeota archaeon]